MDVFDQLQHFNRRENWGKPNKMDPKFLFTLDPYRHDLRVRLYVAKGVSPYGNHDFNDSAHYVDKKTGYASGGDFFPLLSESSKTLFDCFLKATKYPFAGIGIYPKWRLTRILGHGKVVERGGLHLDTKPRAIFKPMQACGHWIGMPIKNGRHEYFEVTQWNLKKFGII